MRITLIISLLFLLMPVFSQEFTREYGKIPLKELTFNKYTLDTTAEAVIIYDVGKSRFVQVDNRYQLLFERTTRIRIIKNSGIKWGEVEIPYYYEGNVLESVVDIEASSYNIEDGLIQRKTLDLKSVYDEKVNDFWRIKKFAIPNVKEGTILEYKYSIHSPYLFNLRDWTFQHKIPAVYSEYTVHLVPFYEYVYILQGKSKLSVFENYEERGLEHQFGPVKYKDVVYKFGFKDLPAFTDESFITSINDYLIKIDFQLAKVHQISGGIQEVMSTWPKLCNDLLKEGNFGKYCQTVEKSSKEILNFTELNSLSKQEQLEYIVNYVKSNYSWNKLNGKFASKSFKEFQKEKTGNSANINLFLAGLLKGAGFDANPVIISTRGNGSVYPDYPFLHFFNYVVVMVTIDNKIFLTDATDPSCPYDRIPPRCLNNAGLIIKKDGQDWIKLGNPEVSYVEEYLSLNIEEKMDSVKFRNHSMFSIYEAMNAKTRFRNEPAEIYKSLVNKGYHSIDSIETRNFQETKKKFELFYKAAAPIEKIDEKIYLSPFLSEPLSENPLKSSTRNYPVDFVYPFGRNLTSKVNIPKGYKAEYIPAPLKINNDLVSVDFKVLTSDDSMLTVIGVFSFKKAIYEPAEYANVRYIYNEIIKKFNEKIVLTKI